MTSLFDKGFEHCFNCRVYVEDTDLMGVVYHANYLRFFERARTEMLRNAGISLTTMATYGTYFAVHDLHIQYKSSARLDDLLTITTKCEQKKACGLLFKQVMNNQLDLVLSAATTEVVCVNEHFRPKRMVLK